MTKLTKELRAELEQQFARFDVDNNGQIDKEEFQLLLRSLGEEAPEETLSLQFAAIDADGDGAVQFEEFAEWWLDYR